MESISILIIVEYGGTKLDSAARFFYNDTPNKIVLLFSSVTHTYKENG